MIYKHATHLKKPVRFSDTLDIVAVPDSTAVARIFLKRTLQHWRAAHVIDDMLTVGTELVTNAIKVCEQYADGQWKRMPTSKLIRIRLLGFGSSVAVEVWDRCPSEPQLLPLDFERENGRGLYMVDALSVGWGFYPVAPWGKVVWSELSVMQQAVMA
ncbi:ATP-binding protein [Actinomadura formosensis]|uniref:ATP-binding protein n=1 Tax=Actinomadura formosensis TaxID=60706 RepID=UPI000B1A7D97|nr:ATP-binding protein [Actinomadura formosensis]